MGQGCFKTVLAWRLPAREELSARLKSCRRKGRPRNCSGEFPVSVEIAPGQDDRERPHRPNSMSTSIVHFFAM
jgi:hypothetical protein